MNFRNLGEGFRNHYEKLILTLVLVGLGLAVAFVYQASQREQHDVATETERLFQKKPKPVTPTDLSAAEAALKVHQSPPDLEFSKGHKFVNPVKWKKRVDGTIYKFPDDETMGWGKMFITRSTPLKFIISLDKVPQPGGYFLGYTRESAERAVDRKKRSVFSKINETNKPLGIVLREIRGAPEKPDELVIEFLDSGEKITVSPEKPFERIEGYEADLRHELITQSFNNLRVGSLLKLMNDDYIIVAITESEVVASDRATDKKYIVRQFAPAPNATNQIKAAAAPVVLPTDTKPPIPVVPPPTQIPVPSTQTPVPPTQTPAAPAPAPVAPQPPPK